jgi:hypothetical protein
VKGVGIALAWVGFYLFAGVLFLYLIAAVVLGLLGLDEVSPLELFTRILT